MLTLFLQKHLLAGTNQQSGKDKEKKDMWYCYDCEEYFESPDEVSEYHSELAGMGGVNAERFCTCPMCGGDDIEECKDRCDLCGRDVIKTRLIGGTEVCENCYKELSDDMAECLNNIKGWFGCDTGTAIDLIENYYVD